MCIPTMLLVVACALLVSSTVACHTPVVGDPWYRHADYDPDIKHLTICEGVTEIPYAYFGSGNTYSGDRELNLDLPQSLKSYEPSVLSEYNIESYYHTGERHIHRCECIRQLYRIELSHFHPDQTSNHQL